MFDAKQFGQLFLSRKTINALSDMGFEEPTPIQAETIPLLLGGRDVIGQAQTGTGKTAAFGIPIVEKVNHRSRSVQALVLTPTRELAIQVAEEISKIGKYRETRTLAIYGGQPIERQIMALKRGVQIVVGTPGRILDHLRRKTLRLDNVKFMVLDEADEMLDMGFIEDIELIIKETPAEKQTFLFSATMPAEIRRLASRYLNHPEVVSVNRDELTVPQIEQQYYEIRESNKTDGLCRILDTSDIKLAIVFCRTKRGVDELAAGLQTRGYQAEGLHGDLNQVQRDRIMKKFRESRVEMLVATDVAARGLDIDNVSHVINFDLPQDPESYVHRIGRTGRAGKAGVAISFVTPGEYKMFRTIEKLTGTMISKCQMPSLEDVLERQKEEIFDRVKSVIEEGKITGYRNILNDFSPDYDLLDVAAAALKLAFDIDDIGSNTGFDGSSFGETGAKPGMVRFFINVGREDEVKPPDVIKAITEEAGISTKCIGDIKILDKFSFVDINLDSAERVLQCMYRSLIKGKRIHIAPAKTKRPLGAE